MSMADDDDVGRDLSQLLVLANIFLRDALPPDGRTLGQHVRREEMLKFFGDGDRIPGVQTLRGKIGLRHMGGHG